MSVASLSAHLRAQRTDPLLRSANSLMLNSAVTGALGVVYWVVAARIYGPQDVGRDAALIAAMIECSVICQLNMGNAITRFLPSLERGSRRALLGAYAISAAAALLISLSFVVLAPVVSSQFSFLRDGALAALYVVAQVLWGWFVLEDAALTAVRQAPWVPVENGVFGLLKLAALPMFHAWGVPHGVFLAWTLPIVVLLVPVNLFLFRTAIPRHVRSMRPGGSAVLRQFGRRGFVRFMAQDWGASVFAQAPSTLLPVLVVALLGSRANAYFYIPYTIVGGLNLLFFAVSTSLVVEGALAEDRIRALARKILRRFVFILGPGVVVLIAGAPLILLPFGPGYVRESASALRILACGCVFYAATVLYEAIARLHGHGSRILLVEVAKAVLLIGGVAVLPSVLGLDGVALAWLVSVAVVAAAILPSLLWFLRAPPANVAAATPERAATQRPAIASVMLNRIRLRHARPRACVVVSGIRLRHARPETSMVDE